MSKRTDPHRPGAIIPAHYKYVLSYSLPSSSGGYPMPGFRLNCESEFLNRETGERRNHDASGMCCVRVLMERHVKFSEHGHTGKCSICGARFVGGDVWLHEETGEHIHLGHNCADKYEMLVDRSSYELEHDRFIRATAIVLIKEEKAAQRAAFLDKHPGLEAALQTDHYIIKDIKARFTNNCFISPKQIDLVMKLHNEATNPAVREDEKHVDAPIGKRIEFAGKIVSRKVVENDFGSSVKITIKVFTPDGVWLAYGTAPGVLQDAVYVSGREWRSVAVKVRATLEPSDKDKHFCFMKRPTLIAAI